MSYLGAAESFVSHGTLRIPSASWDEPSGTSPLDHFPPGFSLALAVPIALGVPPVQSARLIESASAGSAMGLAVWLVAGIAGPVAGALAGVALLVQPALALDHLRVLSEPLFLLLLVASLALMLRRPDRPLAYGVAAALSGLVRYAGVAVGAGGVLWAATRPGPRPQRMRRAALAAGPTLLAQALWALRTRAESGTVRTLGVNGDVGATLREGLATVGDWLAPQVAPTAPRAVSALVVGALAAMLLWRASRRDRPFFGLLGLVALCYAGVVLASRLFADAGIPFDGRLLSPLFVLATLAVSGALGVLWRGARLRLRVTAALLCTGWLGASAWSTAQQTHDARDGGWGYADQDWQASGLVQWLREEGARRPVFSNNTPDVWFANGRNSWSLPATLDTLEVVPFGQVLKERGGALVGFARELYPTADPAALARALGLVVLARFHDGTVWGFPPH
jgi:hypothetical protein